MIHGWVRSWPGWLGVTLSWAMIRRHVGSTSSRGATTHLRMPSLARSTSTWPRTVDLDDGPRLAPSTPRLELVLAAQDLLTFSSVSARQWTGRHALALLIGSMQVDEALETAAGVGRFSEDDLISRTRPMTGISWRHLR